MIGIALKEFWHAVICSIRYEVRQSELKSFLKFIEDLDPESDRGFAIAIKESLRVLNLTEINIAGAVRVSTLAVREWMQRKHLPHPVWRKILYGWMKQLAQERLNAS